MNCQDNKLEQRHFMARWGTDERILLCIMDFLQMLLGLVYYNILNLGSMVGYFALKKPLKMCVTQKTRRLCIFPGISHFEGIAQFPNDVTKTHEY